MLLDLYNDDSKFGRRGVLSLEEAIKIVQSKMEDKARFVRFVNKYGKSAGVTGNDFKGPGLSQLRGHTA